MLRRTARSPSAVRTKFDGIGACRRRTNHKGVDVEPERRDREWENWPGRGTPDGSVRGRLRGLFSPTDLARERDRGADRGPQPRPRVAHRRAHIDDRRPPATRGGDARAARRDRDDAARGRRGARRASCSADPPCPPRRSDGRPSSRRSSGRSRSVARSSAPSSCAVPRSSGARPGSRRSRASSSGSAMTWRRASPTPRNAAPNSSVGVSTSRSGPPSWQRSPSSSDEQTKAARRRSSDGAEQRRVRVRLSRLHLLVVPGAGYRLVHRDGAPPAAGDRLTDRRCRVPRARGSAGRRFPVTVAAARSSKPASRPQLELRSSAARAAAGFQSGSARSSAHSRRGQE